MRRYILYFVIGLGGLVNFCHAACDGNLSLQSQTILKYQDEHGAVVSKDFLNSNNLSLFTPSKIKSIDIGAGIDGVSVEVCSVGKNEISFRYVSGDSNNTEAIFLNHISDSVYLFSLSYNEHGIYTLSWVKEREVQREKCSTRKGNASIKLNSFFKNGEVLVDSLSGKEFTVESNRIDLPPSEYGAYLFSKKGAQPSEYSETSYYVMLDRFSNGDVTNDFSYGRKPDNMQEIGTFHGGDLDGLISKLDYIQSLGVTSVIISNPLEQVRGWVGGGDNGDFPHYGYHGFYTRDFRNIDQNFGTWEDLKTLGDELKKRKIKLFINVTFNHPGMATLMDMQIDGFGALKSSIESKMPLVWNNWRPQDRETWHSFNEYIDFSHPAWDFWWGRDWVRAQLSDYDRPGYDKETGSVHFLPDFKTESNTMVSPPGFYFENGDTMKTVREYLLDWHVELAKQAQADGFLLDAEPHLDANFVLEIKDALKKLNENFILISENFGHGIEVSNTYSRGSDYVLNFNFQDTLLKNEYLCLSSLDLTFQRYSNRVGQNNRFFSFISWFDTYLIQEKYEYESYYHNLTGFASALVPGPLLLLYGDEVNRTKGPAGSDSAQGTRSDMPWELLPSQVDSLELWRNLLNFRRNHIAIEKGKHVPLQRYPYAFSRKYQDDVILFVQY